jgi:ribosomal protein S18 acetylase RimI-like enzyme
MMAEGLEIREVETKADLKKFILYPHKLYEGNDHWVPNLVMDEINILSKDKNPAFSHCESKYWLAYRNGNIVGRIAGIVNKHYIEKWKNNYVRFGWMDFINDEAVSKALTQAVENWAAYMGMTAVHGPLGFTDLDPEGLLISGFDEIGNMASIYNYPYYDTHLDKLGYQKDTDWIEFEITVPDQVPEKIARIAEIVRVKSKLRVVQTKSRKDILPYSRKIFDLLNITYAHLYGVTELTDDQINAYIKQYFGFIRHDFVSMVVDEQDNLVGFGISMPSLSKALRKSHGKLFPFGFVRVLRAMQKNDRIDLYLIGVHPKYQNKGVNAMLLDSLTRIYIKNNIKVAEAHHELEDNTKVQSLWTHFDSRKHKRRRCYIKHLS